MFEIEDAEKPAGTVVQVIQPGYRLHDRLLRPARVGISKGGPAGNGAAGSVDTQA
jgi:molecular chaperone GrpE